MLTAVGMTHYSLNLIEFFETTTNFAHHAPSGGERCLSSQPAVFIGKFLQIPGVNVITTSPGGTSRGVTWTPSVGGGLSDDDYEMNGTIS